MQYTRPVICNSVGGISNRQGSKQICPILIGGVHKYEDNFEIKPWIDWTRCILTASDLIQLQFHMLIA